MTEGHPFQGESRIVLSPHIGGVTADAYVKMGFTPLYFGLADAKSVEEIAVTWPSGKRQVVPGPITINTTVVVTER